ncbi:ferritin-like domain-containing protein [Thomasclavelia saccharogumia]|uniref:ferritin-like domain-containing protein n=1 Tax=Thomasclavelia saccharogumia TaxID=341225 RepID=UPI00047E146B|nr:ferritin family protein [Thomasclavelia saccharogumia]
MNCKIDRPYPKVAIEAPNETYGLMILDNVGGMNSKISAISQYIYDHAITSKEFLELKQIFLDISLVEIHHLNIFMELALKLEMDPRWWTCLNDQCCYWSPSYLNYPQQIDEILQTAIDNEYQAINKYMYQIKIIKDPFIVAILKRIIEDEELHIKILKEWQAKLVR